MSVKGVVINGVSAVSSVGNVIGGYVCGSVEAGVSNDVFGISGDSVLTELVGVDSPEK